MYFKLLQNLANPISGLYFALQTRLLHTFSRQRRLNCWISIHPLKMRLKVWHAS
jgi:hypothetical protein